MHAYSVALSVSFGRERKHILYSPQHFVAAILNTRKVCGQEKETKMCVYVCVCVCMQNKLFVQFAQKLFVIIFHCVWNARSWIMQVKCSRTFVHLALFSRKFFYSSVVISYDDNRIAFFPVISFGCKNLCASNENNCHNLQWHLQQMPAKSDEWWHSRDKNN